MRNIKLPTNLLNLEKKYLEINRDIGIDYLKVSK